MPRKTKKSKTQVEESTIKSKPRVKLKHRPSVQKTKQDIQNSGRVSLTRYLPEFLIILGLVMVVTAATHWILRFRSLSFDEQVVAQYQIQAATAEEKTAERPARPTHIYAQWFIDVPIEEHVFSQGHWTISDDQASYLAQSARPGEKGNIIVYGHNTRDILGNIRAFTGDEIISITTADGTEHSYQITQLHEVEPDQVEFLQPTNEEVLTIYTCSGFLDSKRFIVRAVPFIEP